MIAAGERATQCSVPNTPGWRPGARWARSEGDGALGSRASVETAVAALPAHRRPPQRELGRVSEGAGNPFTANPGVGVRELGRRTEAAGHPFQPMPPDEGGRPIAMPAVRFPDEGPHPDQGQATPTASTKGEGRFFQTGRTLGNLVARIGPDEASSGDHPGASSSLPPLVTIAREGGRVSIQAACPAALALGVVPGMALTQARASFPGLDVRDADPAGDAADLARLALTLARRWTPVVAHSGAGTDGDGLVLDLTGVAHLHGGEARMARRLVRLLARHGVAARIAVADTVGASWALARFGRSAPSGQAARIRGGPQPGGNGRGAPGWSHDAAGRNVTDACAAVRIVSPGCHLDALAPLPIASLRVEPHAAELLARLGVDTVGQLAAMPRGPLARRFGTALVARLDQASGTLPEPLDPVVPVDPVNVRQRFAEPIATAEAIAYWLGELVPQLAEALARAGLGARLMELVADRVDGVPQALRVGLARPTRDPAHLLRLLVRRIEEIDPGYGIDALALHVRRADPLGPETLAPQLDEETPPDLAPLIDALANRIGTAQLWRCSPVESDVPERSVSAVPPLDPPLGRTRGVEADDVRRLDERGRDHPWHPRWPRPVRLLRRPEPVEHVMAELPDRAPARFTWRGRVHRVVRADGPERIAGEWWRRAGEAQAVRDYFQVEDETGGRFWLYRRGDGVRAETGDLAWFLHGRFG